MADVLSDYLGAMNRSNPAVRSGSSSIGTTIFVMNIDAKTASSDFADPTKIVYGAGDDNEHVRPIVVPSMGLHLELCLAYWGTAPTADLPVVAVYGEVPACTGMERYWPQDVDSTLTLTSADDTAHDTSFWVPLLDQDSVEYQTDTKDLDASNLIALNPDAVAAIDSDGGDTTGLRLTVPRRVYLSGCTRVICTIQAAADNADKAMVLGRFVG